MRQGGGFRLARIGGAKRQRKRVEPRFDIQPIARLVEVHAIMGIADAALDDRESFGPPAMPEPFRLLIDAGPIHRIDM